MRVLITGGTGFIGQSLANYLTSHSIEVVLFSRHEFDVSSMPLVSHHKGDVMIGIDLAPTFDVIIHAATPASVELNLSHPREMFMNCVNGMQSVLRFAERHSRPVQVLFTSSGAVYGEMPMNMSRFKEDTRVAVESFNSKSAYAEGKRAAEFLLAEAYARGICDIRLARLFAFSGELLPITRHFALGNFIRDAVSHQSVVVRGDGKSVRSYLDQSDMAIWLHTIIERGEATAVYHVGSEREISIGQLATLVCERYEIITGVKCRLEIQGLAHLTDGVSRYVPSTLKTRRYLSLRETVSLEDSVDTMLLKYLRNRP
jgi:nucleoside-diphosphate-sugar epimerase